MLEVFQKRDTRWRENVVTTKKWHVSCRQVCHWCFYHSLMSSWIYYWTDPWQHWIYLFYTMIRKEKRPIHIPASYCLTVRGLGLVSAFFKSLMLLFVSASSFLLYPTCMEFLQKVFHVFSCSKQNNGENIYKTARLYYRWDMMATVVKISCSLGILK